MVVTREQLPTEAETVATTGVKKYRVGKRSVKQNNRKFGTSLCLLPTVVLKSALHQNPQTKLEFLASLSLTHIPVQKKAKIAGAARKHLDPPQLLFEEGQQVEVLTQEEGLSDSWYIATVIDLPPHSSQNKSSAPVADLNKYHVEYESIPDDKETSCSLKEFVDARLIRPLPPITPVGHFSAGDTADAFYYDGWWVGVVTKCLSNSRFRVKFEVEPVEKDFHFSELRIHLDWVHGQWVKRPNQAKEKDISGVWVNNVKRRGRPPKVHKSLKSGNESNVGVRVPEGTKGKDDTEGDVASILIGLSDGLSSPESSGSGDTWTLSEGTAKGTKQRKYGTEDLASILMLMSRDETANEDKIPCHSPSKESPTSTRDPKAQGNVSAALEIKESEENGFGKQNGTPLELSEQRSRVDVPTKCGEKGICVMPSNELGKGCLGEGGSRVHSSTGSPLSIFYGVSPKEIEVDGVATIDQNVPFEKTIVFWDSIETMEVFQIFPQKPHFRTLENTNEDLREGLALGQMVTFSNIVKMISKMQADTSKTAMEKCLENLRPFEDNGFDVRIFRDRLNDLILKKDKRESVENDLKEQKIKSRKSEQRQRRMLMRLK